MSTILPLVCGGPAGAQTVSLTVLNPGFEALTGSDPVHFDAEGRLLEGHFARTSPNGDPRLFVTPDPVPGWTVGGTDVGTQFAPQTAYTVPGFPQGRNTVYFGGTIADAGTLTQALAAPVAAGVYSLFVDIGRRSDIGFAGYTLELLAGGSLVAKVNDTLTPAAGGFVTSNVSWAVPEGGPEVGSTLVIRLSAPRTGSNAQTNFDNVRLTFTPAATATVPEPGTLPLVAVAAALPMFCAFAGKRRSR